MSFDKTTLLRLTTYLLGFLALLVAVVAHVPSAMESLTKRSKDDGDLFGFAQVSDFRIDIPLYCPAKPLIARPAGQPILLVGDSFSQRLRCGFDSFPEQLASKLNVPVFHADARDDSHSLNPFYVLAGRGLAGPPPKLVVFEIVEREMLSKLNAKFSTDPEPAPPRVPTTWPGRLRKWRDEIFAGQEQRYQLILKHGPLSPVVEWWNTLVFRVAGVLSDTTPVFSSSPPMLFYYDESSPEPNASTDVPHPDSAVAMLADNLAALRSGLKSKYGAELLFMPVPNKFTIYRKLVDDRPYDEYLPRLYRQLETRGVPCCRLYEPFLAQRELIYFQTDSHWNQRGLELALATLSGAIRNTVPESMRPANPPSKP